MEKKIDSGKIWLREEADNWFKRNRDNLGKQYDPIMFLLELYRVKPKKIMEIGCSNGFRLAVLHNKYNADVFGVEPSKMAIKKGKKQWPFINFIHGLAHSVETKERFDLVVLNFVFHWIDRQSLFKTIYRIDEILDEGGILAIGDFYSQSFIKRYYHHRKDVRLYTYKQRYDEIFLSSGLYRKLANITFDWAGNIITPKINISNMASAVLLKKEKQYINVKNKNR